MSQSLLVMMSMKIKSLLVVGFLYVGSAIGAEAPSSLVEINEPMTEMGHWLETSLPIIYDQSQFADPDNKKLIQERISQLQKLFHKVEPHLSQKSVGYKVSTDVLDAQINMAAAAFARDETPLARHILKGIPEVCAGCHIQDGQQHKLFQSLKDNSTMSEFSKGELSFITREYDEAIKHFTQFLNDEKRNEEKQLKALERLLVIYGEVYKEPHLIKVELEKYKNFKHFSPEIHNTLDQWLIGLEDYVNQSGLFQDAVDYSKLDEYMVKHYTRMEELWIPNLTEEKDKIFYIMLRSSLHDYLNQAPKESEVPALLYWLAVCDRTLEYHFYYSMADWYLKECIKSYPTHPYAHKCYQAYEDYLVFSYTGSRGTDLPKDVLKELSDLKMHMQRVGPHQ